MSDASAAPEQPVAPKKKDVEIVDVTADAGKALVFEKSFVMTWTNVETGRVETGTFTARRPTLGVLGQIAVLQAKMNGGQQVDQFTGFYHQIMASLQFILVDFPDWWKPADFFDASPLREVWEYVTRWLESFHPRRVG